MSSGKTFSRSSFISQHLKVPDMIHNIIPQFFSNPLSFWYQKFSHIFLTFVVKFGLNIPNTLGEINGNVAWKL